MIAQTFSRVDISLTSHPLLPFFLPAFVLFSSFYLSLLKEKINTYVEGKEFILFSPSFSPTHNYQ